MADPIEAMREAIRDAILDEGCFVQERDASTTLDGDVDLNVIARAAWKLALDVLEQFEDGDGRDVVAGYLIQSFREEHGG